MCAQKGTQRGARQYLRWLPEDKGAEIVEFAVAVPVLVMLLIGIIWFGRAYNTTQTLTRAAREGARFATAPTCITCGNQFPTETEVRTVVDSALVASALDPGQVAGFSMQRGVVLNPGTTPQTVGVVVSFSYPFRFILPFTPLHLTTISLPIRVQMREE